MDTSSLTPQEKELLLRIAREAIEKAVRGEKVPALALAELPPRLRAQEASFVTLTKAGALRGCIGALQAYQPLAADVQEHAIAAALDDPRFPPVQAAELAQIAIEVSRLTPPQPLDYQHPADLPRLLRPHVDGVILRDGWQRATFLPQVWQQLPRAEDFLAHLCLKMGADADIWQRKKLDVQIYQVEEFHE